MKIFFAAISTLLFFNFAQSAQVIECPLKITVNYKIAKSIPSFQFRDQGKETLDFLALSMFDQDPKNKIVLAPDNATGPQPHKWTLAETILPWVVCTYGKNGEQSLIKKLIKEAKLCTTKASKADAKIFNKLECQ